jgi:hypothetical protein
VSLITSVTAAGNGRKVFRSKTRYLKNLKMLVTLQKAFQEIRPTCSGWFEARWEAQKLIRQWVDVANAAVAFDQITQFFPSPFRWRRRYPKRKKIIISWINFTKQAFEKALVRASGFEPETY